MQQTALSSEDKKIQEELQALVAPLLAWYDSGHRILPWREKPDAYRVWISEIMLQQTRVEAVRPYFDRFLKAFPDVLHLADAPEEEVLKLWEGLGYYSRARNLKKAAVQIGEKYSGVIPDTYEALLQLPGIGSYTAGAIASIAFGRPVPAVDGNVLRILARVRMDAGNIMEQRVRREVWRHLLAIMPSARAGDFNQALMELGAVVCIPNGMPKCAACPWRVMCRAAAAGKTAEYPKKSRAKPRKIEEKTVLLIQDENRTALRRRPSRGLLAGMYEFPSLDGHRTENEVLSYLSAAEYKVIQIRRLENARHVFTHKEWHMIGYAIRVDELERPARKAGMPFLFAEKSETEEKYPIPAAFAVYARYLQIRLGNEKYLP